MRYLFCILICLLFSCKNKRCERLDSRVEKPPVYTNNVEGWVVDTIFQGYEEGYDIANSYFYSINFIKDGVRIKYLYETDSFKKTEPNYFYGLSISTYKKKIFYDFYSGIENHSYIPFPSFDYTQVDSRKIKNITVYDSLNYYPENMAPSKFYSKPYEIDSFLIRNWGK